MKRVKVHNPIGRPPVKRSDIWPILLLFSVNFITSGTFGILTYHFFQHPEKQLSFWNNWFMPFLYWPVYTLLTYGMILAWRARWLDNVIESCQKEIAGWKAKRNEKQNLKAVHIMTGKDDPLYRDQETQAMIDHYEQEHKRFRLTFALALTVVTFLLVPLIFLFISDNDTIVIKNVDSAYGSNTLAVLNWIGFTKTASYSELADNPQILDKYDRVILLSKEYASTPQIANHVNVFYLYPPEQAGHTCDMNTVLLNNTANGFQTNCDPDVDISWRIDLWFRLKLAVLMTA